MRSRLYYDQGVAFDRSHIPTMPPNPNPMPAIPEDSTTDFSNLFHPEKIVWTFDKAIDAVQSINFVGVAHYICKAHYCEPRVIPSSQHGSDNPSNTFFVVMDYAWPPRFIEGIYESIE
ncbi:hypothetical protein VNI00_014887 [Paramarasmius palmivorus]|uniref:Uncharacterized protein n=1 Tax=Paramarasmius palmivorus TaxID=297713 RepID=A0AAW0BNF8_9AGAR